MRWFWLLFPFACGSEGVHRLADGCVAGSVTMTVNGPDSYACHAPFTSTIVLTNDTCDTLTVSDITVTTTVTDGSCTPPAVGIAQAMTRSVAAGSSAEVLDFAGNDFCCFEQACPATFECDEAYAWTAETSAGSITGSGSAHLSLGGCDVICP